MGMAIVFASLLAGHSGCWVNLPTDRVRIGQFAQLCRVPRAASEKHGEPTPVASIAASMRLRDEGDGAERFAAVEDLGPSREGLVEVGGGGLG